MAARKKPTAKKARSRAHRREPDELAARVGARVRHLRTKEALTFDAFVEATGLGRGYVSELERGLVVPTVGTLARIAGVLRVTLADLVADAASERERIFEELRKAPASTTKEVRRLLDRLRRA